MTLRQLQYFIAVVDAGSFTRASERLRTSQPGISQQIRALERELGGALLKRLPDGLRLTEAGVALLAEARIAVDAADLAARNARLAMGDDGNDLRIGFLRSFGSDGLHHLLQLWHGGNRSATVCLSELASQDALEECVHEGRNAVGVGPSPRDWDGPVATIGWEELVPVVGPRDSLAGRQVVSPSTLRGRDWIIPGPDHGLHTLIVDTLRAVVGEPTVRQTSVSHVEIAAALAASGAGVALLPRSVIPERLTASIVRLDPSLRVPIAAFARRQCSANALRFVRMLEERPQRLASRLEIASSSAA